MPLFIVRSIKNVDRMLLYKYSTQLDVWYKRYKYLKKRREVIIVH